MSEPRLCYVSGCVAWFTTQDLTDQWGDDWDDAPYEHNAGEPYSWRPTRTFFRDGGLVTEPTPEPEWTLSRVVFLDAALDEPSEHFGNSPYSVERINTGAVPWLVTPSYHRGETVAIFAGTTIPDFKAAIRRADGRVFVDEMELVPA